MLGHGAAAPNYNVAPTTTIATVVTRHNEPDDEPTRRVRLMRWGLVPPWAKAGPDGAPEQQGPAADQRPRGQGRQLAGLSRSSAKIQALPGPDGRLLRMARQPRHRGREESPQDAVLHAPRRR